MAIVGAKEIVSAFVVKNGGIGHLQGVCAAGSICLRSGMEGRKDQQAGSDNQGYWFHMNKILRKAEKGKKVDLRQSPAFPTDVGMTAISEPPAHIQKAGGF